jgi:hypothetical protein
MTEAEYITYALTPIIVAPMMPTLQRSDFDELPASSEVAAMDFTSLEAAVCWRNQP